MQLTLNGKNINITNALREYVTDKLEKITKHNGQIMNLKVTLSVNKNPSVKKNNTAEVNFVMNGTVIKIEETAETMYAAIDLLSDKIDRQVREAKKKLVKKGKTANESIRTNMIEEEVVEEEEEIEVPEEAINIELQ